MRLGKLVPRPKAKKPGSKREGTDAGKQSKAPSGKRGVMPVGAGLLINPVAELSQADASDVKQGPVESAADVLPWDLVNKAPTMPVQEQSGPSRTYSFHGELVPSRRTLDHKMHTSRVVTALKRKADRDRLGGEVEMEIKPDYNTASLVGLTGCSTPANRDRTRVLLRLWARLALALVLLLTVLIVISLTVASRLSWNYKDVSTLENYGSYVVNATAPLECSIPREPCCRGCSDDSAICDKCSESYVLELTCCPTKGSYLKDDQGWIVIGTFVVSVGLLIAMCTVASYVFFIRGNGRWTGLAAVSSEWVKDHIRRIRSCLIADTNAERKVRRVADSSDDYGGQIFFFTALEPDATIDPAQDETLQVKNLPKPGQTYGVAVGFATFGLAVYLIIMHSFVALEEGIECFSCDLRDTWNDAVDQTYTTTSLLRTLAFVELLVFLLLALLVYILSPFQFGRGKTDGPKKVKALPKVPATAPLLSSLWSLGTTTSDSCEVQHSVEDGDGLDLENGELLKKLNVTEPTWVKLRTYGESLGFKLVNFGSGNLVAEVPSRSLAAMYGVPDGVQLCEINGQHVFTYDHKLCLSIIEQESVPISVTLPRPYGFSTGISSETGLLCVQSIVPDGHLHQTGMVEVGDHIVSFQGVNTVRLRPADFAAQLQLAQTDVATIEFGRTVTLMLAPRAFFAAAPITVRREEIAIDTVYRTQQRAEAFLSRAPTRASPDNLPEMNSLTDSNICATPTLHLQTNDDSRSFVEIRCETQGASIYYTTDGSIPYADGSGMTLWYGSTVPYLDMIDASFLHLRAIAVKPGLEQSNVADGHFDVDRCAAPILDILPADRSRNDPFSFMEVHMSCITPNCDIMYRIVSTPTGSDETNLPFTPWTVYDYDLPPPKFRIRPKQTSVITALARGTGKSQSPTVVKHYIPPEIPAVPITVTPMTTGKHRLQLSLQCKRLSRHFAHFQSL